ncbi:MAG: DUF4395 domain-containing protein [Streptomycetaceae bacterium]|nr:DUF4395 domain-containing protein [Streptomycetaceae bacterium]
MTKGLDPRGPRFAAAVTSVVLAVVVVTGNGWLLVAQAAVFAVGAFAGPGAAPYGMFYRRVVAPRLAPPAEREDPRPVRFAQFVGLAFAVVGAAAYLLGAPVVGMVAAAGALFAAYLNAAFGLCLGCEMYLRYRRVVPARG